jgi:hypothetical protein
MNHRSNSHDSELVIIEADASKFVPRKITDPKELERIRKLVADLEKYGYMKPRPPKSVAEDPPPADPPPAG